MKHYPKMNPKMKWYRWLPALGIVGVILAIRWSDPLGELSLAPYSSLFLSLTAALSWALKKDK